MLWTSAFAKPLHKQGAHMRVNAFMPSFFIRLLCLITLPRVSIPKKPSLRLPRHLKTSRDCGGSHRNGSIIGRARSFLNPWTRFSAHCSEFKDTQKLSAKSDGILS